MSNQHFHDRVYFRVPGHGILPVLFNDASNVGQPGRRDPHWDTFRPKSAKAAGTHFLTEEQVVELAVEAREWADAGMVIGTGKKLTSADSAERYILNGIKQCMTLEDFIQLQNKLTVRIARDTPNGWPSYYKGHMRTSHDLVTLYAKHGDKVLLDLTSGEKKIRQPLPMTTDRKRVFEQGYGFALRSHNSLIGGMYVSCLTGWPLRLQRLNHLSVLLYSTEDKARAAIKRYVYNTTLYLEKVKIVDGLVVTMGQAISA